MNSPLFDHRGSTFQSCPEGVTDYAEQTIELLLCEQFLNSVIGDEHFAGCFAESDEVLLVHDELEAVILAERVLILERDAVEPAVRTSLNVVVLDLDLDVEIAVRLMELALFLHAVIAETGKIPSSEILVEADSVVVHRRDRFCDTNDIVPREDEKIKRMRQGIGKKVVETQLILVVVGEGLAEIDFVLTIIVSIHNKNSFQE